MNGASGLLAGPEARQAPMVMALHCSGGSARQWQKLAERVGGEHRFVAPVLMGAEGGGSWAGTHAFRLADEATGLIEVIDRHEGPVHLVGHSFGGGLALHIAARRPDRLASLGLYEPSAFHLLGGMGPEGQEAVGEIAGVAGVIRQGLAQGSYRAATACFVDYWNGEGAFDAMKPELQARLVAYLPKASLDFHALVQETTPASAYAAFGFPVLVLRGEHAPRPTRLVARQLLSHIPGATGEVVAGAGHMGPVTHADAVADRLARSIFLAGSTARSRAA